jgi:hypothetical protein
MRGEVEIWNGEQLLYVEPNMIVDGAGELLADIMTVSPSLSSVNHLGTSSILDASNYRIQAISFGTGKDAFNENAHRETKAKLSIYAAASRLDYKQPLDSNLTLSSNGIIPVITAASSQDLQNNIFNNPIGYDPIVGVPVAPDPTLNVLEPSIEIQSLIEDVYLSSVIPSNGQLTNFLPSSLAFGYLSSSPSANPLIIFDETPGLNELNVILAAAYCGAFPDGSANIPVGYNFAVNYYTVRNNDVQTGVGVNTTLVSSIPVIGGYFNSARSMDISGFVTMIMSSVPAGTYQMSSAASGLCMSADSNFSSNGVIEYSVSLASGDLTFANAYGGIYHLGLWTIDMEKSLQNGNTPPFAFTRINNPRKYKLFCRKGLSKNLCYTTDERFRDNLTIKWRLHFL